MRNRSVYYAARLARVSSTLAIALASPVSAAAGASDPPSSTAANAGSAHQQTPNPLAVKLTAAINLIMAKQTLAAIAVLDEVIAGEQASHASETRTIYSAHTPAESLMYLTMAAADHKSAIVLDKTWAQALFLKGFELIDAGRRDEAQVYLQRAVAMAPLNAQYLNENAEYKKVNKDFTGALVQFNAAADAAEFAQENRKDPERRRAWRGMAYIYVEQGKLDEAEALYRKCLAADPNDKAAAGELGYVDQQRRKLVPR